MQAAALISLSLIRRISSDIQSLYIYCLTDDLIV